VALAAVVNADAESSLNPLAVGDNGHSVGLFQLNDIGGKVVFSFDRTDPHANTRAIINEFERLYGKTGKIGNYTTARSLGTMIRENISVADLAAEFAAIVERPQDIAGAKSKRTSMALQRFGDAARRSVHAIEYAPRGALTRAADNPELRSALLRRYWWAAAIAASLAGSTVAWVYLRRRRSR
jgi:hypothetical protein